LNDRFYIGDLVKTVYGVGRVAKVSTWRDRLLELEEYEIEHFCEVCKSQVGINFKEKWIELIVIVNSKPVEVQAQTVVLLEGRGNDCENTGLESFSVKKSKRGTSGEQGENREGVSKKEAQSRRQRFATIKK
jgi:RNA polymerase subunit RPABC4/transcription elongation factor Spt4